jgi:hypothetical protein
MAKRRLSRDEWRTRIDEMRGSGLTCEEYCAQQGLHPKTMAWWERTLRKGGRASKARSRTRKAPTFVEVTGALAVATDLRLELEVSGVKVRVPGEFEADALARVLSVLEARR